VTAVSGENATDLAAAGMTRPLTRKEQKTVCGSVLRQAEERVNPRKVKRLLNALTTDAQNANVAISQQEKLLASIKKLGALLFPAKP